MLLLQILFCSLSPWLFSPFNPFAKTVTRYIDDTYGDLVTGSKLKYHPTDSTMWKNQSCGTAQGCRIVFDTQRSHNGTYTAATYRSEMNTMGFSFSFQGTSIAVYFILANGDYDPSTITSTECDFILDGLLEGSYAWDQPPDKTGPEYNVEAFRKEGLENRLHTLKVETGTKTQDVYIAFDYATYTVEEPDENTDIRNGSTVASPSQSSESNPSPFKGAPTGAIVGGVIGGIVLIVSALPVFFVCRKRRQLKHERPGNILQMDPFTTSTKHAEEFSSDAPALAPGPPEETSDISMRLQQQFDRMREELSNFESRRRYVPSSSSTIGSEVVQGEMTELGEQIREFQVQMQILRQEPPLIVANTRPPSYRA
ncbi:hypothetical protein PQX77_018565 [Marasmius sp. AFHP31]|nr:hypothetical protein PQX77_018565 [Marasmius sp. AFHP31]